MPASHALWATLAQGHGLSTALVGIFPPSVGAAPWAADWWKVPGPHPPPPKLQPATPRAAEMETLKRSPGLSLVNGN